MSSCLGCARLEAQVIWAQAEQGALARKLSRKDQLTPRDHAQLAKAKENLRTHERQQAEHMDLHD
jgi:hypothetical protein